MKTRVTELLGIEYPIIQGGMAWVADHHIAAAVSEAGGLGLIAAANAPAEWVREQIREAKKLTDKPFGVNIMLMSPNADEVAKIVVEEGIKVITTGAGSPEKYMEAWKAAGVKVIPVVASVALAKRMERCGADAVVAEGTESGGHIGETTTMALVPQVVDAVKIPVIAAGGIADGRGIAAAFMLGAEAVQMGTRFVATQECNVHENYKQFVLKAKDIDTRVTGRTTGHPVRTLRNPMTKEYLEKEAAGASFEELELLTLGGLPGQGAQKAGMGKDFYEKYDTAKKVFDSASKWLDLDMKALCFEENDKLDLTEYTQAALVTTCLAMEKVVEEMGLHPDVTAGLSLGEYCAIEAAGGMELCDAITTVRKRGILMEQAVPAGKGSMAAVMGMETEKIEEVIADISDVSIANYNCPGQIVITGLAEAVAEASEKLKSAGARRVIPLNVSGPFHSAMLITAGKELGKVLEGITLHQLKIPYVTNVTAEYVEDPSETKALLEKQISSSVRWQQSVENMIRQGVDTFVEIGPGRTLAGFMRKIDRNVKVYNIQTVEDAEKVCQELK